MCTVLLPPSDNPIAVNKYIISYQNPQLVSLLMQVTSLHTIQLNVFELHIDIILPFTPRIFQDLKPEN